MSFTVNIGQDLKKLPLFLNAVRTGALQKAVKRSLNRALSGLRTKANQAVRQERKLQVREITRDYFRTNQARGNNIESLEAGLAISGRSVSLIRFVRGSKDPRSQKGITIRQRRPLRVEVKPGRQNTLKKAFIARTPAQQMFVRAGTKSLPIIKKQVPSLASLFRKDTFRATLEKFAGERYVQEFTQNFAFFLGKLRKNFTGPP